MNFSFDDFLSDDSVQVGGKKGRKVSAEMVEKTFSAKEFAAAMAEKFPALKKTEQSWKKYAADGKLELFSPKTKETRVLRIVEGKPEDEPVNTGGISPVGPHFCRVGKGEKKEMRFFKAAWGFPTGAEETPAPAPAPKGKGKGK